MRRSLLCLGAFGYLSTIAPLLIASAAANDDDPAAVVQHLFDAMAAHNADAAGALFTPEATLLTVRADGTPVSSPHEQFVQHVGASKDAWLERMWKPTVLVHGGIAVVWAEYDFHLNGKLNHCGVDSVNLVKTPSGLEDLRHRLHFRNLWLCAQSARPSASWPAPLKPLMQDAEHL